MKKIPQSDPEWKKREDDFKKIKIELANIKKAD